MPLESILELIPHELSIGRQGEPMVMPPHVCSPLQLMQSILSLHLFRQPQQAKLLIKRVQPFLCLEWLLSFLEYGWLSVLEIFEITILIGFCTLMNMSTTMGIVLSHCAHSFTQSKLNFSKHGQELCWCGLGWWWKILIVILGWPLPPAPPDKRKLRGIYRISNSE
jgi:hypothetical protein